MCVSTGNSLAVPLTLVHCNLLVRPTNWSLDWCNSPINWQQVTKADSKTDGLRYCYTINADSSNSAYRSVCPLALFCLYLYVLEVITIIILIVFHFVKKIGRGILAKH